MLALEVALHVRAWIETIYLSIVCKFGAVALHVRAWIETAKYKESYKTTVSRPPCEGVD